MTIEKLSVSQCPRGGAMAESSRPRAGAATASPATQAGLSRLYPALENASFRLLWLSMLPATLAVMMNQVASPYAAFVLSGSAAVLGVVSLAQGLPMLGLSLVGGVAADRLPRRQLLIGTQLAQGLAAAVLAALGLSGQLQVWHVVAATFVQGAAFAFNMPARQAYIAELVTRPQLANAAALNNAGQNFCRVAGPALAGALLGIPGVGIGGGFLAMAAMYATALLGLARLPARRPATGSATGQAGRLTYLAEGLRYARSTPAILALIGMNLIVVVFGMPYQTLMPVAAERVFDVGASGLGLLMAASGVGALAGAVVVASLPRLPHPGTIQVGLAVGLGGALLAFSTTRSFGLALVLLLAVGFLFSSFSALNNTLLMAITEARLTGRVMSIYLLTWGAMPLGSLPLAWLADRAGAQTSLTVAGTLIAGLAVALALLYPAGRRIGWSPRSLEDADD
jgi:MFS family permease